MPVSRKRYDKSPITNEEACEIVELWKYPQQRKTILSRLHFGLYVHVFIIARISAQIAIELRSNQATEFCDMLESFLVPTFASELDAPWDRDEYQIERDWINWLDS